MPRLFVALDPPPAWKAPLRDLATDTLDARWTPPKQHHVTLHFIGEVPDARAEAMTATLDEVKASPFPLQARGLIPFPSHRNPRVLVVGIEKISPLMHLHEAVGATLREAGFAPEERAYRPHLTVARLKGANPRRVRAFVKEYAEDLRLDPAPVEAFHLYESQLHPDGAQHHRRRSVALGHGSE